MSSAPDSLRATIREAYAQAGVVVFERRQRGENVDLYDVIADALTDRYDITEKEQP